MGGVTISIHLKIACLGFQVLRTNVGIYFCDLSQTPFWVVNGGMTSKCRVLAPFITSRGWPPCTVWHFWPQIFGNLKDNWVRSGRQPLQHMMSAGVAHIPRVYCQKINQDGHSISDIYLSWKIWIECMCSFLFRKMGQSVFAKKTRCFIVATDMEFLSPPQNKNRNPSRWAGRRCSVMDESRCKSNDLCHWKEKCTEKWVGKQCLFHSKIVLRFGSTSKKRQGCFNETPAKWTSIFTHCIPFAAIKRDGSCFMIRQDASQLQRVDESGG